MSFFPLASTSLLPFTTLTFIYRDGTESFMCETVRTFASLLADAGSVSRPDVSVFLWDERFSSAQAEAMLDPNGGGLKKKIEIDSLAASLILEHYFAEGARGKAERLEPGIITGDIMEAAGLLGEDILENKPFPEKSDILSFLNS